MRRELVCVAGSEEIGPYTLLRLERGSLDPGAPGQFFMLEAPGRLLPRPMSRGRAEAPRGAGSAPAYDGEAAIRSSGA